VWGHISHWLFMPNRPQKVALLQLLLQGQGATIGTGQTVETISFLKHRRFDPELVDSMSAAYASVCQALGLSTESDWNKIETVALKIIEIAARGARSPTTIHLLAMDELGDAKQVGIMPS
jgi:hypothetical protein